MDMNDYKTVIGREIPHPVLIRATREKMKARIAKNVPRRKYLIAALAAACAIVLSLTAFTYGGEILTEIKRLVFGDSSIAQVGGPEASLRVKIVNRSSFAKNGYKGRAQDIRINQQREIKSFTTYEEANKAAPFRLREPGWIPENINTCSISVLLDRNGKPGYDAIISYFASELRADGTGSGFELRQYYAGPDAHIEVQTAMHVEKVMIGDIEGSAIPAGGGVCGLYWMKDEIAFEMSGGFDLDTMIAIAESI